MLFHRTASLNKANIKFAIIYVLTKGMQNVESGGQPGFILVPSRYRGKEITKGGR